MLVLLFGVSGGGCGMGEGEGAWEGGREEYNITWARVRVMLVVRRRRGRVRCMVGDGCKFCLRGWGSVELNWAGFDGVELNCTVEDVGN